MAGNWGFFAMPSIEGTPGNPKFLTGAPYGVAVVHDLAAAQVHLRDRRHLIVRQGKIPDVEVLSHAIPVDGLGDDGDPALNVPAQHHLSWHRLLCSMPVRREVSV